MKNISERISQIVADVPESVLRVVEKPEKAAEELWALWREFRSLSLKKEKSEAEQAREKVLLSAVAERWHNPIVREVVIKTLRKDGLEREKVALAGLKYDQIRNRRDKNEEHRLDLFKEIFKSGGGETGELEQIKLAELEAEIEVDNKVLEQTEKANPELAARLSYERLRRYQRELAKGFIWTPSRHKYFNELLHRAVVLNQNRPVLMYGESGTGKTRLIREATKRLSGEPPFEVGEEAKNDIRPLLGSKKIDADGNYVAYGPLARALIGKQTSRDETAGQGGVFYMDEMNGYPADGLRALIKQISGLKVGDTISFATWEGKREKVAPGFIFVGSANLLSEKHQDRPDLPNELKRELAPSSFEVDYPPQTPEDPEFFEMCLAALMDNNGRVRASAIELSPAYVEIVGLEENLKIFNFNIDKKSGGALWRFAQMVAEIQRCYKLTKGTERIDGAPFDPGVAFAWLAEYRKSAGRRGESLQNFLVKKLDQWIGNEGGQKLFSTPDIKRLKKICEDFGLSPDNLTSKGVKETNLTSLETGRLSPRVSKPPERIENDARPPMKAIYSEDGMQIEYHETVVENIFYPSSIWVEKGKKDKLKFLGQTEDKRLVFERGGLAVLLTLQQAKEKLEKFKLEKIREVKEVKELFGKDFFGVEQIEKAFTIKNEQGQDIKLIDLTPVERQHAEQMLLEKLHEPDIQAFLQNPENQQDIKDGKYLLILRVNKIKVNGKETPLTMKTMQETIAPDMKENSQGKLLYKTDWYQAEDFYTNSTPTFEWIIVTTGVVESTLGKDHPTQTTLLNQEAERIGLDPKQIKRREPVQTVFDHLVSLRAANQRILLNRYDWSDILSSSGNLVFVGCGDFSGLHLGSGISGDPDGRLGASLSPASCGF